MAKRNFKAFTPDDILDAWLQALKKGLGRGRQFSEEITDLEGDTAKRLRKTINAQLKNGPFNAAAFRASTRVATDLGQICGIMAAATQDKVVTLDVFQRARDLTKLHNSCPEPVGGAGPFC
jgi:hypothetical protein